MFPNLAFPNLLEGTYRITSPATERYNCVAWAAEDVTQPWWPQSDGHLPVGARNDASVEAFVRAFATLGYVPCGDGEIEEGFVKVALYALGPEVKHAARQLPTGWWTSKLGKSVDIEHDTPEAVTGPVYGVVVQYLKRPI